MLKKNLGVFAVLSLVLASAAFAGPNAKPALTVPVTGTFTGAAGPGVFEGRFELAEFGVDNNQLVARGTLIGTLTYLTGVPVGTVMKTVEIPVQASTADAASTARIAAQGVRAMATCPILHLDLGPLHLDLLGLTVDLNQVVLDIAAESGAGNLLGNLLCAVTGLLDGAGALIDIARLLNQILDILTGLLG